MPSAGKLSNRLVQPGLTAVVGGGGAAVVEVGLTATGGNVTTYTANGETFRVHTFTSSGSFTIAALGQQYSNLSILVVGGGSGGYSTCSGGGGGVVRFYGASSDCSFTRTGAHITNAAVATYTVTVGSGGAGGATNTDDWNNGTSSSIIGTNVSITSASTTKDLGGWSSQQAGTVSGSYTAVKTASVELGSFWFSGGSGTTDGLGGGGSGSFSGGSGKGGGFLGQAGNASNTPGGGHGGMGGMVKMGYDPLIPFSFGGGGGGGRSGSAYQQQYGPGFMGSGGRAGLNATTNSGGGGGGTWDNSGNKNGASGIVIVKYRIY